MASERSAPSYGYRYCFSIDYEILSQYKYKVNPGYKTFLFEVRTNFITESTNGQYQTIDSERFAAEIWHPYDGEYSNLTTELNTSLSLRLKRYRMNEEEIDTFEQDALDFVEEQEHAFGNVIPVVVNFEVRTVQQNGELLCSVVERAIRAENLVPLYLFPWPCDNEGRFDPSLYYFLWKSGRIELKI